ncbi:MAG: hypothetical protein HN380_17770 [Victivallales bacterium]|jgi:hypothetical protein|nr:hypothetical protein [Victivallales bacterium]
MLRLLCPALAIATLAAAKPTYRIDEHGTVRFGDDLAGIRAVVSMHGPDWSNASATSHPARKTGPNEVAGRFPAPSNCQGELIYGTKVREVDGTIELAYSLEFTKTTAITGAYVSFYINADQFEGQRIALLRSKTQGILPKGTDGIGVSGQAPGVFVGTGTGLTVAMNATGAILPQNMRGHGGKEYELRFILFGNGTVRPGLKAQRVFRIARTTEKESEKMVAKLNPPRQLRDGQPFLLHENDGTLQLRDGQRRRLASIHLAVHGPNWSYVSQAGAEVTVTGDDRSRSVGGSLEVPQNPPGTVMDFAQTTVETGPDKVDIDYRLSFPKDTKVNGYQASLSVPLAIYAGKGFTITAEGKEDPPIIIPTKLGDSFLHEGTVQGFALAAGDPNGFAVTTKEPMHLLVQDNRNWGGDTIEFRFCFARIDDGDGNQAAGIPAGHSTAAHFALTLPKDSQTILNQAATPSRTDTADWVPFVLPWDSAPVDVSFLNHKPAGKHGFVQVRDGKFVLDGSDEEIRFWGTCFSAGANFPSHEQSEKIARRLAAFGINMVRTHHADAPWAERHFFPKQVDNTREFDKENLDRFDYLVLCLKREGIYLYLDQLVHRRFKTGDGVDAVDKLEPAGKPYSNFDPRLIELQKEFSRNIWTHVNPYTKLAYKDDPAIALMEFTNENDLFTQAIELEPYRSRLEVMYRAWGAKQGVKLPAGKIDFTKRTDPMTRFLIKVQADYYREMGDYLRQEVGVHVPMTGSNWSRNAALLLALDDLPFTDSHAYHNHPSREGVFGNNPMVGGSGTIMDGLGFQSRPGKAFFVSEWDQPWPNEWRAEMAVWMGAVAAFQGWNGLTVYTYRHSVGLPVNSISGAFETFNDPARFGLFPHAALAYRRRDFTEGEKTTLVQIPKRLAASAKSPSPWSGRAYRGLAETQRFRTAFGRRGKGVRFGKPIAEGKQRQSSTGQIQRDIEQRILLLDSPRTQAITGFLAKAGEQKTSGLTVTSTTTFATIAASALDDRTLNQSGRILLTAVGRAENTDFTYNLLRNRKLSSGSGPILIDPVRATISLRTTRTDLQIIPVAADGTKGDPLASRYADGALQFEIGPAAKTIYYLVQAR